jgi:predicted RND superfamily exporter protein
VGPQARAAALLIQPRSNSPGAVRVVVERVRTLLARTHWPRARLFLTGTAVVEDEVSSASRADLATVLPVVLILVAAALLLKYRAAAALLVSLGAVLLSLLAGIATYVVAGYQFNMIAILLPPVLAIIAVENSIHLIDRYLEQRQSGAAPDQAARRVSRQLLLPCLITSATTALGFLSFALAQAPALHDFGIGAACAIGLTWLITFFGIPAALPEPWVDRALLRRNVRVDPLGRWALRLGRAARRRPTAVWLATAAALLGLGAGLPRITVTTSILSALPIDSAARRAEQFLERRLAGSESLEVLVGPRGGLLDLEFLQRLDRFQQRAAALPEVSHALSLLDLLKRLNQAYQGGDAPATLPSSEDELADQIDLLEQAPEARALLARHPDQIRLTLRLRGSTSQNVEQLEQKLSGWARQYLPGASAQFAGSAVELGRFSNQVVESQRRSLLFALGGIVLLLTAILGSLGWGLLGTLPNLLALLGVYGLMGWLAIPLSLPTAMIASVSLGLAVDVAIQLLARYRRELAVRPAHALERTLARTGGSIIAASAVLILGFWAGGLGSLAPSRHFALLTGLALLLALLADLTLLPVLLSNRPPRSVR